MSISKRFVDILKSEAQPHNIRAISDDPSEGRPLRRQTGLMRRFRIEQGEDDDLVLPFTSLFVEQMDVVNRSCVPLSAPSLRKGHDATLNTASVTRFRPQGVAFN
jgi:hypothetical protein